jgi:uncharacterized MnhB-related membrane protein
LSFAVNILLLVFLLGAAVAVVTFKDLLAATIAFSVYSLVMSILWSMLRAPDVALTEAAVGAGVTTVLFIITIYKTGGRTGR